MAGNIEVKDCHIVELGAGTGFLGLHLLKSIPSIKSYNFTDGHRKYNTTYLGVIQQLRVQEEGEGGSLECPQPPIAESG